MGDIELDRVGENQILLKGLRLARLSRNEKLQEWLGYELNGYPDHQESLALAIGRRAHGPGGGAFLAQLTALTTLRDAEASRLQAFSNFSVSGEWANVQADKQREAVANSAAAKAGLERAIGCVTAHLYSVVTEIYHELLYSEVQAQLFEVARAEIDARLSSASGSALAKVDSISDRLRDGDTEAISQAMSSCRRLIDAAADAVFPPSDGGHEVDGQPLKVGAGQVKNRIAAHLFDLGLSKGRRDRLRRTVSDLYDRTSSGLHSEVTIHEARYVFLQTYVVLGEVLTAAAGDQAASETS